MGIKARVYMDAGWSSHRGLSLFYWLLEVGQGVLAVTLQEESPWGQECVGQIRHQELRVVA